MPILILGSKKEEKENFQSKEKGEGKFPIKEEAKKGEKENLYCQNYESETAKS